MKIISFKDKKGFTLIEIMVAVTIFAIVMVIAIGSVLSITNANRKAQALNTVINNLNFAVDSMVRNIRTGENYSCSNISPPDGSNCSTGDGSPVITFYASNGHQITYTFIPGDETTKGYIEETDTSNDSQSNSPTILTAADIDVNSLKFYVSGSGVDGAQPKVLLQIQGQAGAAINVKTNFNIQTLISQRLLDQ